MLRPVASLLAAVIAFGAVLPAVIAAPPGDLNQLLEEVRTQREREAAQNKEREARFLAERNKRAQMLAEAKADLAAQQRQQAQLSAAYDANEKKLTDLQAQLDAKAGNLGEMFGVVRQTANDFSSVVRGSLISAQYPDREEFVTKLANAKGLPSITDLERFWFEMLREMTESGATVLFKTNIVEPDGESKQAEVVRVGPFVAASDGRYLTYLSSQKALAVMARQPGSEFTEPLKELQEAKEGFVATPIDPTRGVLLSIYAQRPSWIERIEHGEWINYVILAVGLIGLVCAIFQLIYLLGVRTKVRSQLRDVSHPRSDNPLGRVLSSFKAGPGAGEENAEVIELRISEAVLREVPRLERFQAFLRLAVAAGPLLGLIGTVIGMIITFQSITESGSSDPKLMAAGISAAMIATVLGLGIAIPLLFLNAWLTSMSRSIIQILDEQSTGLLAESLEGKARA